MAKAVGVSVFAEGEVLVAVHDLDVPVIAIERQQQGWRSIPGIKAGNEPRRFGSLVPLSVPAGLANAGDAADLPYMRPGFADIGGFGGQDLDPPCLDPPMSLFYGFMTAEGKKPAR